MLLGEMDLRLSSAIAWGIPVDILDLTANVKVHRDTKAALKTLRSCARPGTSFKTHLSKLPPELVAMIENYVVKPARSNVRRSLSRSYQCFQEKCEISDHIDLDSLPKHFLEKVHDCPECDVPSDLPLALCEYHQNESMQACVDEEKDAEFHMSSRDEWYSEMVDNWNVQPEAKQHTKALSNVSTVSCISVFLLAYSYHKGPT